MLKIGVDLRTLGWQQQAGIPRMVHSIFKELTLYTDEQYPPIGYYPRYSFGVSQQINFPLPAFESFGSDKLISLIANVHNIDVLFSFYYPLPTYCLCSEVLFIHDLIPVRFPGIYGEVQTQLFNNIRHSAESCQRIITNSQASKQDIM